MADGHRSLPPALVAAVCAGAIALGGAVMLVPPLLHDGTAISSTPIRSDRVAHDVTLARGERVCLDQVALDRDSAVARLLVRRAPEPGAALRIEVAAPGYRGSGRVAVPPHPATADGSTLNVPLSPSPPRSTIGTFCAQNVAGARLTLVGTDQARALTRSRASLDGVPLAQAFSLTLVQAERHSTLARTPELIDRAAALSPFGPWFFWAMLPLLLLGVPLLVVAALYLALRSPDAMAARTDDPSDASGH